MSVRIFTEPAAESRTYAQTRRQSVRQASKHTVMTLMVANYSHYSLSLDGLCQHELVTTRDRWSLPLRKRGPSRLLSLRSLLGHYRRRRRVVAVSVLLSALYPAWLVPNEMRQTCLRTSPPEAIGAIHAAKAAQRGAARRDTTRQFSLVYVMLSRTTATMSTTTGNSVRFINREAMTQLNDTKR